MPKFEVPMCRDAQESTWIEVEAESVDEALDAAYQLAKHENWEISWELDDYVGDVYCPDPDMIKEEGSEHAYCADSSEIKEVDDGS